MKKRVVAVAIIMVVLVLIITAWQTPHEEQNVYIPHYQEDQERREMMNMVIQHGRSYRQELDNK